MMKHLLETSMNLTDNSSDDDDPMYRTIAATLGGFLGVCGAVIVIFSSLNSPVKAMSKQIIIMISISDILQAFPTLLVTCLHLEYHLSNKDSRYDLKWWSTPVACKIQSFLITTGAMLTFLWTFGLSQHMFLLVRFGIKLAYKAYLGLYVLSILPVALNIIAFKYDVLGPDERFNVTHEDEHEHHLTTWCWIKVNNETTNSTDIFRRPCPAAFWDGKAWEISCYLGVTVYCVLARYYLKMRSNYEPVDSSDEEISRSLDQTGRNAYAGATLRVNKILAIPIALILVRMWGTVSRITCYCIDPDSIMCSNGFFLFMENFCDPLQGFVNCILYKVSLNEGFSCKCPAVLGDSIKRRISARRRRETPKSYEPVTVWVSPNESDSSDY